MEEIKIITKTIIQQCVDYYESTGIIDNVSADVKRRAFANQAIILKHKI